MVLDSALRLWRACSVVSELQFGGVQRCVSRSERFGEMRVNPNAYGFVPVATNAWGAAVSCSRAGTEALAHHP
jgi:hypothetical protein